VDEYGLPSWARGFFPPKNSWDGYVPQKQIVLYSLKMTHLIFGPPVKGPHIEGPPFFHAVEDDLLESRYHVRSFS